MSEMTPTTLSLLAASDHDAKLLQLHADRTRVPAKLALDELEKHARVLVAEIEALALVEADLSAKRDQFEAEVSKAADRLGKIEKALAAATGGSAKDLSAMDAERSHLATMLSSLETSELEILEELDPLSEQLLAARVKFEEMVTTRTQLLAQRAEEEAAIDLAMEGERTGRTEAIAALPADLAARYEQLSAKLKGPGAARLSASNCSGCYLEVPRVDIDRIRHLGADEFANCDECGRILVHLG
ncbi:MAG: C4-type zinc ribbon domain-containing protein [Actinobacteria bacterium]|nr:C4-type zinc ribbon domain-containing protein [Actinomycetota bacterium]